MNDLAFLQHECQQVGFELTEAQLQPLCRYATELEKWSKKMNLVAGGDARSMLADHFLDSLCLYPLLTKSCKSLLDVGTGAGFPGLVLGSVIPDMQVTLVEPRAKRVAFLRHIIRTLGLTNITIIPERLEVGMDLGLFDGITSRAFAELGVFLPLVEPYLTESGAIYSMKGPKGKQEFARFRAKNPWSKLRLRDEIKASYPPGDHGRCIMIFST